MTSPLIFKKMSDVMKEIGAVGKDQKNTAQGFKFRGIDQFVNALYPALCKHGVFMVPSCVEEKHEIKEVVRGNGKTGVDKHVHLKMNYTFFAEDGSSVIVGPIPSEGLDSGDKATNKGLSAALKYALIQTFSIPTQDMEEGDSVSPEMGVATQTGHTVFNSPATDVSPLLQEAPPAVGTPAPTKVTFKKNNKPATPAPAVAELAQDAKNEGWD